MTWILLGELVLAGMLSFLAGFGAYTGTMAKRLDTEGSRRLAKTRARNMAVAAFVTVAAGLGAITAIIFGIVVVIL